MPSSGMLCRLALVRTDVSDQGIASIMRVEIIDELWNNVSSNYDNS
jgi:hypothetical protein